jgi:hypothetical protein
MCFSTSLTWRQSTWSLNHLCATQVPISLRLSIVTASRHCCRAPISLQGLAILSTFILYFASLCYSPDALPAARHTPTTSLTRPSRHLCDAHQLRSHPTSPWRPTQTCWRRCTLLGFNLSAEALHERIEHSHPRLHRAVPKHIDVCKSATLSSRWCAHFHARCAHLRCRRRFVADPQCLARRCAAREPCPDRRNRPCSGPKEHTLFLQSAATQRADHSKSPGRQPFHTPVLGWTQNGLLSK